MSGRHFFPSCVTRGVHLRCPPSLWWSFLLGWRDGVGEAGGLLFCFFYRTLPEARSGHLDIATVLLDARAEVNAQNHQGWTALMFAVKKRKTERRKRGPIIVVWVALECYITLRGLYPGILFFPAPVLCLNLLAMYLKSLKFLHLFFFVALLVLTPWNASQSASG